MPVSFTLKHRFPVTPEELYTLWLNSSSHAALTGAEAEINPEIESEFYAWDGYITGKNIGLEKGRRIVQLWRTADFSIEDAYSKVEILLEPTEDGCLLTLIHSDIPDGQPDYASGWDTYYFEPMASYFYKGKK